jgi:hypothetical protein
MNLKQPITLPILWNGEANTKLIELGLEPTESPEIRKITFYTIDHVYASKSYYSENCTTIVSSGIEYMCDEKVGVINMALLDKI